MAPPMMIPTSASSSANAPTPLMICCTGPAPGMALKSGVKLTLVWAIRWRIGGYLRWSCRESIGHGGGYLQVRASGNGTQTLHLRHRTGGQVRVPRHLHHRTAALLEVVLDLADLDQALVADGVDHRHRVADQLGMAVLVEPVQRGGGGPGRVQAWRHHHHDLVGELE